MYSLGRFSVGASDLIKRLRQFGDFLAQRVLGLLKAKRLTMISRFGHGLAAIWQMQIDCDIKAFLHSFQATLALQVSEFRGAVQNKADLVKGQVFGLKRALQPICVLCRPHIEFDDTEIDLSGAQHGFRPLNKARRHIDHDKIKMARCCVQKLLNFGLADNVEWRKIGWRGENL